MSKPKMFSDEWFAANKEKYEQSKREQVEQWEQAKAQFRQVGQEMAEYRAEQPTVPVADKVSGLGKKLTLWVTLPLIPGILLFPFGLILTLIVWTVGVFIWLGKR